MENVNFRCYVGKRKVSGRIEERRRGKRTGEEWNEPKGDGVKESISEGRQSLPSSHASMQIYALFLENQVYGRFSRFASAHTDTHTHIHTCK